MNINKAIFGAISTAALVGIAASAATAQANQETFATVSGSGTVAQKSVVFTYTGGPTGQFGTTAGSAFLADGNTVDQGTSLTFTGFSASGMATGTGTAKDPFSQGLTGGTFSLTSATGTDLLSGSFGSGDILAVDSGATNASITSQVNNVSYDGGTYFTTSGLANPGSFSIQMTSFAPPPSIASGYLSGFTAGGGASFSAAPLGTAVPEPATVVPFLFGGLGLLALAVRKRKAAGITA